MNFDFIPLNKLGVGTVLVRHEDIVTMEITPCGFTRIEFGYGEHLIVEEGPIKILCLIQNLEDLRAQLEQSKAAQENNNPS